MQEQEVTKEEFKKLYFKYGGESTGWTLEYWNEFYEKLEGVRFVFFPPKDDTENRLFIAEDEDEVSMFLMSEESEDSFFDYPGKD